ncbi:MAG: hypothetical protein Ctma_1058 [Catillopecten margaritatus gill symbiont]|uniref:Cyclic nucleotide-binding domain-containing protein n=1 Tax=Catillopecten margaritatus gill symbiont TaxID=3083288 RepID=A0AAU6PH65_9GAMM
MDIIHSKEFTSNTPWDSINIANMGGITTRLHWTNKAYKWHTNEGDEVFVVLDGQVKMLYRVDGEEKSTLLNEGDIFYATEGTEHVAHPVGEVRVLVVEKEGSV